MSAPASEFPAAPISGTRLTKRHRTVTCSGHGRLPWLGHVECVECGAAFRKQPSVCHGFVVNPLTRSAVRCRSTVFSAECAKCYISDTRSMAPSSYEERGEIGSAGCE